MEYSATAKKKQAMWADMNRCSWCLVEVGKKAAEQFVCYTIIYIYIYMFMPTFK